MEKPVFELYRKSTLGQALVSSLDALIEEHGLTDEVALRVMARYDEAINKALGQQVTARATFQGPLQTFRLCDDVWTFVLRDSTFRVGPQTVLVDKVKIVAMQAPPDAEDAA